MARKSTKARKYRGPSRPVDPRYNPARPASRGPDTFGLGLIAIGVVVVILIVLVAGLYGGGAGQPATTSTGSTGNTAAQSQDPAQATSAAATAVEVNFATQTAALPTIDPAQAISMQAANTARFFDVRSKTQYDTKHITGSANILYTDAPQQLSQFPKDGTIILYCQ